MAYMGLTAARNLGHQDDRVFIGSCTNARIEDLRIARRSRNARKSRSTVQAMVVPGSGLVKKQGGRRRPRCVFKEAGFEWREPGCSMCLAMNADVLSPESVAHRRAIATFERTVKARWSHHLVSPAMRRRRRLLDIFVDIRSGTDTGSS